MKIDNISVRFIDGGQRASETRSTMNAARCSREVRTASATGIMHLMETQYARFSFSLNYAVRTVRPHDA
jgi:hypothetical protein